jgi:hypothetical protein
MSNKQNDLRYGLTIVNDDTIHLLHSFFEPARIPYAEQKLHIARQKNGEAVFAALGGGYCLAQYSMTRGEKTPQVPSMNSAC